MAIESAAVDHSVTYPNASVVGNSATFGVVFWFRTGDTSGQPGGSVYYEEVGSGFPQFFAIEITTAGLFKVFYRCDTSGTFVDISSAGAYDDDVWHWGVFTRRGATDFELFVDGVSVGTSSNNPANPNFNGVTRVMNTNTLTTADIAHLVTVTDGLTLGEAKNLAYGRFYRQTSLFAPFYDTTCVDLSGNDHAPTIDGGVTQSDHAPIGPIFGFDVGLTYEVVAAIPYRRDLQPYLAR